MKEDKKEGDKDVKRMKITRGDIEEIGFSDGCQGCNAMRRGVSAQNHSEYCRRRVEEHLRGSKSGVERLEKAEKQNGRGTGASRREDGGHGEDGRVKR